MLRNWLWLPLLLLLAEEVEGEEETDLGAARLAVREGRGKEGVDRVAVA